MNEREPAPLWLALLLVLTAPAWLPVAPLVAWWRSRPTRRARPDTLPLFEFFADDPATA